MGRGAPGSARRSRGEPRSTASGIGERCGDCIAGARAAVSGTNCRFESGRMRHPDEVPAGAGDDSGSVDEDRRNAAAGGCQSGGEAGKRRAVSVSADAGPETGADCGAEDGTGAGVREPGAGSEEQGATRRTADSGQRTARRFALPTSAKSGQMGGTRQPVDLALSSRK